MRTKRSLKQKTLVDKLIQLKKTFAKKFLRLFSCLTALFTFGMMFASFDKLKSQNLAKHQYVHLDREFSGLEQVIIKNAFEKWSLHTENFVTWEYTVGWPDNVWDDENPIWPENEMKSHVIVIRGLSDDEMVKDVEERLGHQVWGYAVRSHNPGVPNYFLLVVDKIHNEDHLQLTAEHEIGHILGLDHTEELLSIMNTNRFLEAGGITPYDILSFQRLYQ